VQCEYWRPRTYSAVVPAVGSITGWKRGSQWASTRRLLGAIAAGLFAITACSCGSNGLGNLSVQVHPILPSLGTPDGPGHPDAPALEYFGQQVEQLSQGTIRIKAVFNAVDNAANFDLATIQLIEKGRSTWVGSALAPGTRKVSELPRSLRTLPDHALPAVGSGSGERDRGSAARRSGESGRGPRPLPD
jgi:hypothetical protein